MQMHDSLAQLDWWGCMLAAFLPLIVVALIALPVGGRISDANDDSGARGRLIALVAAAFAFIVAFSTNTLWTQDLAIHESARAVGQSTSELRQESRKADPELAERVRDQLVEFDKYSETNDADAGLTEGSTGVKGVLNELSELLTESPQSTPETADAYDTFHDHYLQYLLDLNAPSIPNLIVLVVLLLGVVMVAAMASSPRTGHWMSTRTFVAAGVFVIGLYQFPLWVLNSRKLVLNAVHPYLSPLDSAEEPSGSALGIVTVLLAVVIVVIVVVLVLPGLLRRKAPASSATAEERRNAESAGPVDAGEQVAQMVESDSQTEPPEPRHGSEKD